MLSDQMEIDIRDLILATLAGYDDIMRVQSGQIESGDFISGSQGWQLNSLGNLEANGGNFRGDITGASGTFSGVLSGATITGSTITGGTIQTATSGARVLMTSGNVLNFNIDNTVYASLYTYNGGNFGLIVSLGASSEFKVIDGSLTPLVISAYNSTDCGIKFNNNKRIYTDSSVDKIRVDANWNPDANDTYSLGDSAHKWHTLWSKILNTGDIVFSDEFCPLCKKELKEGDGLINYLYKQEKKDGVQNYTVPAHIECYLNRKNNSLDPSVPSDQP